MKDRFWLGGGVALTILLLLTAGQVLAWGYDRYSNVTVEIVSDDRGALPRYPAEFRDGTQRSYVEARDNERYRIVVHNGTGERVGVVIAVDGRNIISGEQSHLAPNERMYVLDPYRAGEFEGWRTGRDQVNRFYFTGMSDSYAAAWGDYSAMGVIAVAAYQGRERRQYGNREGRERDRSMSPSGPRAQRESPGTGFGEGEWSPSTQVYFEPEGRPISQEFIKYEWQSTLCKRGIIDCRRNRHQRHEGNRFWPNHDNGYAPPPPRWGR